MALASPLIRTDPADPALTRAVSGIDHTGRPAESRVPTERPLTIYLNGTEIVTAMTIGDHPNELALGFLLNQAMLPDAAAVTGIDHDAELGVVVVRTETVTDFQEKLRKRTQTSGCAQGTSFGDLMDSLDGIQLPATPLRTSELYALTHAINTMPSIYLEAGAIHGCVLAQGARVLAYLEDVGRHNAVDKISGWMALAGVTPGDKLLYTTGRLTSEMVIKSAQMGVPVVVSRSGITQMGLEVAQRVGLCAIGRATNKRFLCYANPQRLMLDAVPQPVALVD